VVEERKEKIGESKEEGRKSKAEIGERNKVKRKE
jgi:hypothetical protein